MRRSALAIGEERLDTISPQRRVAAWLVHLFTASGAILGLLALNAIHHQHFVQALWLMGGTVLIDSVDGALARRAMTALAAPRVDGALLDNIVDYVTYVMVPAFFMVETGLLPEGVKFIGASAVVLASAYQFSQREAKTEDHFFKGFPSYWNLVVFYLFVWNAFPWLNFFVVLVLSLLVFLPIKYIYPSRMTHISAKRWPQRALLAATLLWGAASLSLLWLYPETGLLFRVSTGICVSYMLLYVAVSVYLTSARGAHGRPPIKA